MDSHKSKRLLFLVSDTFQIFAGNLCTTILKNIYSKDQNFTHFLPSNLKVTHSGPENLKKSRQKTREIKFIKNFFS